VAFTRFPLVGKLVDSYRESFTDRGRYLLWMVGAVALLGLDTRENQVFKLFAVLAGILLFASVVAVLPAPRVAIDCRLPLRATALRPLSLSVRLRHDSRGFLPRLLFSFPRPRKWGSSIAFKPRQFLSAAPPGGAAETVVTFKALRRGRYVLPGPTVRVTDPLGLVGSRAHRLAEQVLLVYPRFYSLDEFMVPAGRRYQPGGIPLASNTGDSVEFMGTRDYRQGDPVKNIHWRSWARRGQPVVKEFQEEYFCRLALILDTFLPRRPRPANIQAFEAGISVLASIADFFSRSEYIVDIFAAGPDVYEVSAGRSLAYLENILDVLACLEPCPAPPFESVGPALFEKLAQITSVVAVMQDWDPARQAFLRKVKSLGTEVRALVVKEGPTRTAWQAAAEELGEVTLMTPADVENLLEARREG
jgi:uncharacterized protein (DUF58 family)